MCSNQLTAPTLLLFYMGHCWALWNVEHQLLSGRRDAVDGVTGLRGLDASQHWRQRCYRLDGGNFKGQRTSCGSLWTILRSFLHPLVYLAWLCDSLRAAKHSQKSSTAFHCSIALNDIMKFWDFLHTNSVTMEIRGQFHKSSKRHDIQVAPTLLHRPCVCLLRPSTDTQVVGRLICVMNWCGPAHRDRLMAAAAAPRCRHWDVVVHSSSTSLHTTQRDRVPSQRHSLQHNPYPRRHIHTPSLRFRICCNSPVQVANICYFLFLCHHMMVK